MAASAIRKKLIIYLADADDKKVKAIYTLLEGEITEEERLNLTNEHIKVLNGRKAKHIGGKDKSSNWKRVHDNIRRKRKSRY